MKRALTTAAHLALGALVLFAAACAKPSQEAVVKSALDAGKVARDAERAACLVVLSHYSGEKEPGLDEYCRSVLECKAP